MGRSSSESRSNSVRKRDTRDRSQSRGRNRSRSRSPLRDRSRSRDLNRRSRSRSRSRDRKRGGKGHYSSDYGKTDAHDRFSSSTRTKGYSSKGKGKGSEGASLIVRGHGVEITAQELRAKFEEVAEVVDVYMPRDHFSGRPKGIYIHHFCHFFKFYMIISFFVVFLLNYLK